jgi:DNA-binding transcriptional regulator YbjK
VATEKGERRRAALVAAAAELLRTGGFEAVRHRAVAEKAGLPLASTTYYFASLDDLVVAAVEHSGRGELAEVRAELEALPRGAGLVLDQLLGRESRRSPEAVILRYERFVGAGRRPYLAPLMREMRAEFDALLVAVLGRAGVTLDHRALMRLVALVDGTVVNSLIEADPDPRAAARTALLAELAP